MQTPLPLLLLLATVATLETHGRSVKKSAKQRLILIALDGMRWDFKDRVETPTLDMIVEKGVSVDYVLNVFPTSTTPNHVSIATGLFPEHHGMVDNSFMEDDGTIFNLGDERNKFWQDAVPIWITNQQQGHKSGVCFWPGFNVSYGGMKATYIPDAGKYDPPYAVGDWNRVMNVTSRWDTLIKWIKKDSDVTFLASYIEEPDGTAHNESPDSSKQAPKQKMINALKGVDKSVGQLLEKLKEAGLSETTNIVLIGDHGHVNTTHEQIIDMDKYIDTEKDIKHFGGFTNVFLKTNPGKKKYVYDKLKNANKHWRVWLKEDIPERFHVKNNSRTGDILVLPDPGWVVKNKAGGPEYIDNWFERGEHGYDPRERMMNPAFFGYGPAFRGGVRQRCIQTVDIYSMMTFALGLKPLKNDGDFERVKGFFKIFEKVRKGEEGEDGLIWLPLGEDQC